VEAAGRPGHGAGKESPFARAGQRLVADKAEYAAGKAAADAATNPAASGSEAPEAPEAAGSGPLAPVAARSWAGVSSTQFSPPDTTGAVGNVRFIELVNATFGIYNKTSNTPLATGALNTLAGASSDDVLFDPQVIWDPGTKRFFYAMDDVHAADDNRVSFGWSKTDRPTTAADFCKYFFSYGADFPDFPKLGDTQHFLLFGLNTYDSSENFIGSDIIALNKPAAGSTCPAAQNLQLNGKFDVRDNVGNQVFTTVPANQTDSAGTGYVVARNLSVPAAGATSFWLFRITRNSDGSPNIPTNGARVAVPAYKFPASAPQKGVTQRLDTSDTRPTQAVSAIDPGHGGKVGIWFQHTVQGGAGAEVRWYELDPATRTMFQSGSLSDPNFFYFNAAISPDRAVNGPTKLFGDSMVLTADRSSSATYSRIVMVSKVGAAAASAPVSIRASAGANVDFTCTSAGSVCRWGDYSGATPDPVAAEGANHGLVWGLNQWNVNGAATSDPDWRTQIFVAKP
jgi:hypothetical protein